MQRRETSLNLENQPKEFGKYSNPVDHRFSLEFFNQAPKSAGVFWLLDSRRNVLYLNKTQNIFQALLFLKNMQANPTNKAVFEVLKKVRAIDWIPAENFGEASIMEKTLLKKFQPEVPVRPPRPSGGNEEFYFSLNVLQNQKINLSLTLIPPENRMSWGSFKGKIRVQRLYASLCRLIWLNAFKENLNLIPPHLTKPTIAPSFSLDLGQPIQEAQWLLQLQNFFAGNDECFLENSLQTFASLQKSSSLFYQRVFAEDLKRMERFYEKELSMNSPKNQEISQ